MEKTVIGGRVLKPEPGQTYLNKKGTQIVYIGNSEKLGKKQIDLQIVETGRFVNVALDYEFYMIAKNKKKDNPEPAKPKESTPEPQQISMPATEAPKQAQNEPQTAGKPKLAHKVDALLKEMKYTVSDIVEKLKNEPEAKDKNLAANIHARLVAYRRQGIKITRTAQGIYVF